MFKKKKPVASKADDSAASPPPPPPAPIVQEIAPEIVKLIEEAYPEEDDAEKREHFDKLLAFPPDQVFERFVSYVWRENARLGPVEEWVEITKEHSTTPGVGLEVGMSRKINGYLGYEEEVIKVSPNKMIELRIKEGLPCAYNKSRVVFKEEANNSTRVIWTIFWTPANLVADMVYTAMMKGFCNLALYRLEQALGDPSGDTVPGTLSVILDKTSVASMTSQSNDDSAGLILDSERSEFESSISVARSNSGEEVKPNLQWAARMYTGYEGNLTPQQSEALAALKKDLQEHHPDTWKDCEQHPDGPDRILLRFLRAECHGKARAFHVEKSKKRLFETFAFRKAWNVSEILSNLPARNDDYIRAAGETVIEDHEGRPVVFTRAGLLSTSLDVKLMPDDDWKRNMIWTSELRMQHMRESSKRKGHEISASVIIYDLKGLGMNFRKILSFTKLMNEVGGPFYPEMVDIVVLVNAPAIFNTLWAAMKNFLDPVTTSKVLVFGQSSKEVERTKKMLRGLLDPKILPKEYGGESDLVVAYPAGSGK